MKFFGEGVAWFDRVAEHNDAAVEKAFGRPVADLALPAVVTVDEDGAIVSVKETVDLKPFKFGGAT